MEQTRTEQTRIGQTRTGRTRTEQTRTEQTRTELAVPSWPFRLVPSGPVAVDGAARQNASFVFQSQCTRRRAGAFQSATSFAS